ncbi:DUF1934 domain-containing protein [Bacillus carboniphilus]|uniref:DUF1934 domain-containing protein n=1 Tax=Bacillus carboniphilus TaxID=86663 RepID=A0ABN0VY92_9BACI
MTANDQEVKITLQNEIKRDQEVERYELTVWGQYFKKAGSEFLKYEEAHEEGTVKTILKWKDGYALLLRSGAVSMRLEHRLDETTRGHYEHVYGTIPIAAHTSEINHQTKDNNQHTLKLEYALSMQESFIGTYKMTFSFQEEKA